MRALLAPLRAADRGHRPRGARAPRPASGCGASGTWPAGRARRRSATPRTTIRSASSRSTRCCRRSRACISTGDRRRRRSARCRELVRAAAADGDLAALPRPPRAGEPGICRRASRRCERALALNPGDDDDALAARGVPDPGRAGPARPSPCLEAPARRPDPDVGGAAIARGLALGRLGRAQGGARDPGPRPRGRPAERPGPRRPRHGSPHGGRGRAPPGRRSRRPSRRTPASREPTARSGFIDARGRPRRGARSTT